MKKTLLLCCMIAALASCGNENQIWEYKIVKVAGQDAAVMEDYGPKVFDDQSQMLNKMGKDGWELVDTYTEIGSAFPNFGNKDYVTGIRENTRTTVLNFIFKRQVKEQSTSQKPKPRKK